MKRSLNEILGDNPAESEDDTPVESVGTPESDESGPVPKGMCIECGDQPADLNCLVCNEEFCQVCFDYIHRTGSRKSHDTQKLGGARANAANGSSDAQEDAEMNDGSTHPGDDDTNDNDESQPDEKQILTSVVDNLIATRGDVKTKEELISRIKEHSRFIPMRLTIEERKLLRLLEAALNVSEYTDKVDILMYASKAKRIVAQIREMCSILAGLVVATDMKTGQGLLEDKEFSQNAEWYKRVFEIGRRYKVMNPEKMRDSFGKLMYMIMDSRLPEVHDALEFDLYTPIKTVYSFLEQAGRLDVLDDPLVLQAVVEIVPDGKARPTIQNEIRRKERAIESLASRYAKPGAVSKDEIRQCLYSIGDYHAYLRANCHPIEQVLSMLEKYFDPNDAEGEYSLAIRFGRQGARLSHDHQKQYQYVKQSLTLWSQVMRDMFMLWTLADHDLANEHTRYRLADTGQGLNRIKACPHVSRAMHGIIAKAQKRTQSWIGSSVVHLGDHTVPNALFFLDKYLQVPRILNPVFLVVSNVDRLAKDPYVSQWISNQFNSTEELKKAILSDFYKHAFDGSGADNFYDAGSCIDGRLTSAWNWANDIAKKPYYKFFLVSGFTGFNGSDGF